MSENCELKIVGVEPTPLFPAVPGPPVQLAWVTIRSREREPLPVLLSVQAEGAAVLEPVEYVVKEGDNRVPVRVPDLSEATTVTIQVSNANSPELPLADWQGTWQPQRKWRVHLVKASHYDLGYDGRVDHMQAEGAQFIDLAKRLCAERDRLHEWHYHIEHMGFVRAYERERGEVQLREWVEGYLKKGHMTLLGNPSGPHWHWMDYEQLARAGYPARRELADRFGLDVRTIGVMDPPSASWPAYQTLAQSGFRYLLRFGNHPRGPGSYPELGIPKVCWVVGPNGRDRLLCSFHDGYDEKIWFGGGGAGGFPELAAPHVAGLLRSVEDGTRYGPYPYDSLIWPNYVDWEIPHEEIVLLKQWREKWRYPELRLEDAAQVLADIQEHHAERIPVLSGDTNNPTGDYASIDPVSQGIKRATSRLLPYAEGLSAVAASLAGDFAYPGKAFNELYIDLVEYDEHCWPTGLPPKDAHVFNAHVTKTQRMERASATVAELREHAMACLVGSGDDARSGDCLSVSVWNPLIHSRTDVVRFRPENLGALGPQVTGAVEAGSVAGLSRVRDSGLGRVQLRPSRRHEDLTPSSPSSSSRTTRAVETATGEETPVQQLSNGGCVFVARDVPSYGYRFYELVSDGSGESGKTPSADDLMAKEDESRIAIENRWYRLTFDKTEGRVTAFFDKALNRELLDTGAAYGLNEWLRVSAPTGESPHLPVSRELHTQSIGKATGRLGGRGPVAAELLVDTENAELGARVETTFTLYADLDRLEVTNQVHQMDFLRTSADRRYGENLFVAFPFQVPDPEFRVEYGPGVADPASDLLPSITDFMVLNRWVDVSNRDHGITLVCHDAPTVHLGRIMYNQMSRDHRPETAHIYSYLWSNRMTGLIDLDPSRCPVLSYSIRSHKGDWREGEAAMFGWRQSAPLLLSGRSAGATAPESTLVSVNQPSVQLSVLKRAEQPGEGAVVRLVETEGKDTGVELCVNFMEVDRAWQCDPVENDRSELPVEGGVIRLTVQKYDFATVRISTREPAFPEVASVTAESAEGRSATLAWKCTPPRNAAHSPMGFNVYRSEDPLARPTLHTLVAYTEEPGYVDSGLTPGTEYHYRVAPADRHNHQGPVSPVVAVRTALGTDTPPAPVLELGVIPMGSDRLTVYWRRSPEPDVALYYVHRGRRPDFRFTQGNRIATVPATRDWYQVHDDRGVAPGEEWHYRVLPADYAGNVQQSSACVAGRALGRAQPDIS